VSSSASRCCSTPRIAKLTEVIILLDEPENHLHPKALLDVVLRLSEQAAQVWIATHSVPLIGSLVARHPECLWYVDGGRVTYAGRSPDTVLTGLVGDDDERDRLRDFLGLPAVLAANRFAAECLLPPGVVDTPAGDPQLQQIREAIAPRGEDQRLRVLDYGAGKARLARELAESQVSVDYVACDESSDHADEARAAIETTGGGKWVGGLNALEAEFAPGRFDVVVLCNVLHEVPPSAWPSLLARLGAHLRDEGVLLLVEDQRVPVGEKAHKDGFVVLDSAEVRALFEVSSDGRFWLEAQDGRLKEHFLTKAQVCGVTSVRVTAALVRHRARALREVASLRDGAPTYKNGQLHAFWSMQFTNTSLVLG
jgi:SAM-dependent methyltransferase